MPQLSQVEVYQNQQRQKWLGYTNWMRNAKEECDKLSETFAKYNPSGVYQVTEDAPSEAYQLYLEIAKSHERLKKLMGKHRG